MIKIFIVDDHIIFRQGLKRVISRTSDIDLAGECGDGRNALHTILKNKYDPVLLDPSLERLNVQATILPNLADWHIVTSICLPV